MTDCEMCRKTVGDYDQDQIKIGNHRVCSNEYRRRYNEGKCVMCGKNDRLEMTICSKCDETNAEYDGYEGLV